MKKLSSTGFVADCADGVQRTVFPALHSYVSDTPEAQRLAACMGWPAACYSCDMPRHGMADRPLDDITQPGKWDFRTIAAHDALQDEADGVAAAAVAANRADVHRWQSGSKTQPSPADAAAGVRAAHKFCEARGIVWARSVLRWVTGAHDRGSMLCVCMHAAI
jgi:hypothetical protein